MFNDYDNFYEGSKQGSPGVYVVRLEREELASCCAAAKKHAVNIPQPVYAALTHLPLTKAQIDTVMRRYPPYLYWDVDQKLKPRIQEYSDRLDNKTLAHMVRTSPALLCVPFSRVDMLSAWLQSWGGQAPQKVLVKCAAVANLELENLQGKVHELELMGVPQGYIGQIVEMHRSILISSSQQTKQRLTLYAKAFEVPKASDELFDILAKTPGSSERLWKNSCCCPARCVYIPAKSWGHKGLYD